MNNGIPTKEEVLGILKSSLYNEQKVFNIDFLNKFSNELTDYKIKWVANPLWQWSRIYEYPFVEYQINKFIKNKKKVNILDAGSGVTFLPFKLSNKKEVNKITCLDYDKNLDKIYSGIPSKKVSFYVGSLDVLDFEDNTFDIVYCISVLEHTENYYKILQEFKRVLKNDGLLIITFDIGLSKFHSLNLVNANNLLSLIKEVGQFEENLFIDKISKNSWSTKKAKKLDSRLLPYPKKGFYKRVKNVLLDKNNFPNLTFYVFNSKIKKI